MTHLLEATPAGLYCPQGGFYIDPWQPVEHAVITHAHGDHARPGHKTFLMTRAAESIYRMRLGEGDMTFSEYGAEHSMGEVKVSLHPAGHILGSAQVRIEHKGEVVVVAGDYKRQADPTCRPYEPLRCHTFVTESTFGLPIYHWRPSADVIGEIETWWRTNREHGITSVLFVYAVGKAQRILAEINSDVGPIYGHGAILKACDAYREAGVSLPPLKEILSAPKNTRWSDALIVAPPSARGSTWLRRFGHVSMALASGFMAVRGVRRRRVVDRGFVLSDHADWPALLQTIDESEAPHVWVTHGSSEVVVRHLTNQGRDAIRVDTEFGDES